MDFPILNQKLRGYVESNPRSGDGLNGMDQYILRSALGYKFRKNIEAYQGYAYINNYNPSRLQESRSYQQFGVGHVLFNRVQVLHRVRTEQRFIEYRDECSNRFRYMLRFAMPIRNTRWYLVAADELFVNLNTIDDGPIAGFDQNRLYGALGRQISKRYRVEVGYQYQHVNKADPTADKANHVLMTQAFISL